MYRAESFGYPIQTDVTYIAGVRTLLNLRQPKNVLLAQIYTNPTNAHVLMRLYRAALSPLTFLWKNGHNFSHEKNRLWGKWRANCKIKHIEISGNIAHSAQQKPREYLIKP